MFSPSMTRALKADLSTEKGRKTVTKYLLSLPERKGWTVEQVEAEVSELAANMGTLRKGMI